VVCITKDVLRAEEIWSALSIRDLTDAQAGPHAMQLLLRDVVERLRRDWRCAVLVRRGSPIVSVEENYDRLHYPPEGAARDARYTRYVNDAVILRTQTSAMIPDMLGRLAEGRTMEDVLLVCPGLVYRRDVIDQLHAGEPYTVDCGASDEERPSPATICVRWRGWSSPPPFRGTSGELYEPNILTRPTVCRST
jgi:phenylalanyl-tRNA synthetase alpha chain